MSASPIKVTDTRASVSFDSRVFSLVTIKSASIKFLDKATFDFSVNGCNVDVVINFHYPLDSDEFLRDYKNEILDQDLRAIVAEETKSYRDIILANAFSKTCLVN